MRIACVGRLAEGLSGGLHAGGLYVEGVAAAGCDIAARIESVIGRRLAAKLESVRTGGRCSPGAGDRIELAGAARR